MRRKYRRINNVRGHEGSPAGIHEKKKAHR